MAENKMKILTMLAEGKITAVEAEKLLNAVEKNDTVTPERSVEPQQVIQKSALRPKNLYVEVEPKFDNEKDRVSIKVPLDLIKSGINVMGMIPEDMQGKINSSMDEKGVNFNLKDIKPDNVDDFINSIGDLSIDVDTYDSTIKIFCK